MDKDIIKAAKTGDLTRVQELLAEDASLLHVQDKDGSTPLHCAVWKGHQSIVELLLAQGADVTVHNQNDHWGTTALHAAAHANRSGIVQLLIEHGADVQAKDLSGNTPLRHTTYHNAKAAAKMLQKAGATN